MPSKFRREVMSLTDENLIKAEREARCQFLDELQALLGKWDAEIVLDDVGDARDDPTMTVELPAVYGEENLLVRNCVTINLGNFFDKEG